GNAQLPANLVNYLNQTFPQSITQILTDAGYCFPCVKTVLYGEGYGAGIQKGSGYNKNQVFRLFDVRVGNCWLEQEQVKNIAELLKIKTAPVIRTGTIKEAIEFVKKGFLSVVAHEETGEEFPAEGLVGRPYYVLLNAHKNRLITKIKTKDFISKGKGMICQESLKNTI
ncbi:MAG: RNA ligase family protein, partial [Planctomycetota bacterium]|nr:RNA ligase family protein [Planctomycetota bacterium]